MLRETFAAGPFQCNCTILACEVTKKAVVIDPGGELPKIAQIVRSADLEVEAIVHTHAHLDHIYCTKDVKQNHGGQICLHKDDMFLYDGFADQAAMFGWKVDKTLPVERFIEDLDTIEFGEHCLTVVHTPGHTPGSVCFETTIDAKPYVFSGDTLFHRSIGRTDLPGGNSPQLLESIQTKLYTKNLDSIVVPGHGPNTTLGDEAIRNPFVQRKTA